jgi:hypothetical protein
MAGASVPPPYPPFSYKAMMVPLKFGRKKDSYELVILLFRTKLGKVSDLLLFYCPENVAFVRHLHVMQQKLSRIFSLCFTCFPFSFKLSY